MTKVARGASCSRNFWLSYKIFLFLIRFFQEEAIIEDYLSEHPIPKHNPEDPIPEHKSSEHQL
jgi:hypothetical protein